MAERVTSYKYGEGETREGQVVQFTAPIDEFELARDALQHFRDIRIPISALVNVEHGGYGRYSRYEVEQIKYGGGQNEDGGGGGYYEILNIKNPPEGRHPVVSHGYFSSGEYMSQFFAEWESTEAAQTHWQKVGRGRILTADSFKVTDEDVDGLIRFVNTGYLSPWFYATGNASLVGDFVFPEHLAQDPTFTFGRKFLVPEKSKQRYNRAIQVLKTCMGAIVEEHPLRNRGYYGGREEEVEGTRKYRAVQWHDGSVTEIYPSTPTDQLPIPLADKDTWVVEAQRKFSELLAGGNMGFEVNFANGAKFVGRYVAPPEAPKSSAAGNYYVTATLDNGEAIEGGVDDFSPTQDTPTIAAYVEKRLAKAAKTAVQVEIVEKKTEKGGKKWSGVYHSSHTVPRVEGSSLDIEQSGYIDHIQNK